MDRETVLKQLEVSRETTVALDAYVELLKKWQLRINLVATSTLPDIWRRHILDCGQVVNLAPATARAWVDLGSGAGLPGLVIAILLKERASGASVTLIESNGKKCAFLREAIRVTKAPATVTAGRIEDAVIRGMPCDIVTARALASMQDLFALASPLFMSGAQGFFLKGQDVAAELTESAKSWNVQANLLRSMTDPEGRIVHVTALSPRLQE
jgi:16S rRNA (guanine527-N7)-methyltransferase